MAKKKITELIASELQPFLEENNYELFNVEFLKEGRDWFLRIFIEKCINDQYENIGTDDCEKVSRFLSERLDKLDPIEQNYYLEVSSPGIDRPLINKKDFERFKGSLVDVSLYEAIDGQKLITAKLVQLLEDKLILLDEQEHQIELPLDKIAKTKLSVVF
ncbi:ribosome maturation factor RimP [Sinanaerobacter sp. ZZT-01]|uniref:ribosome maturation factor RimP n=1 Tax=Sinanaerobacter sp. ZZT-01 TaxID=3111540 RepID=UPI002D799C6C|nr:ribosome maturation factor RimP [Sinanaerobacter sp. ZZT-01]WRR93231.1 ribosome maturation factor RimP [Sinanaerobacter sp. ZZT-01]